MDVQVVSAPERRAGRKSRRRSAVHPGWLLLAALSMALAIVSLLRSPLPVAEAAPLGLPPADASCAALASVSPSATNGAAWGRTILPGRGAPGGWFGVDVCANGNSVVAANGSNVSCSAVPANWPQTGCAPGVATSDGYGLTFQCVELVKRFSAWAFGDQPWEWGRSGWGNAPDLWLPANHPADFVMYPNGSDHAPVPGDILVWGAVDKNGQPWPAGPDGGHGGHIAVVAAVRNGMVITAEENVKWGSSDHPSDALALTHVGSRWILSGSQAHETSLPTYRWRSTMGLTRATYGWLHSVRNTGAFPSKSRATGGSTGGSTGSAGGTAHGGQKPASTPTPTATKAPTATPDPTATATPGATPGSPSADAPGGLPSLDYAVSVTSGGVLADLVWSDPGFLATAPADGAGPSARLRSLGTPPSTALAVGQRPAVVTLPTGDRYVFAIGLDGHLYQAVTKAQVLGVAWTDLGAPDGTSLGGSASASLFAGGVAVVAQGRDGSLWWRAGPAGLLGAWLPVTQAPDLAIQQGFVVTAAPGSGAPLLLAVSASGRLQERIWQDQTGEAGAPPAWTDWLDVAALPVGVKLDGPADLVTEPAAKHNVVSGWGDAPVDVLALDTTGNLWWLRSHSLVSGWTAMRIDTSKLQPNAVLGAGLNTLPPDSSNGQGQTTLTAYVASISAVTPVTLPLPAGTQGARATSLDPTIGKPLPWYQAASAGAVVGLGQAGTAVVVPSAAGAAALGTPDALQALSPQSGGGSASQGATQLQLGTVSLGGAFSDPLRSASVDARWTTAGQGARVVASTSGVSLSPGQSGSAALLQSAQAGDLSLAAHVSLAGLPSDDAQAGLVLYLDEDDHVTLTATRSGTVALCAVAYGAAGKCATAHVKPNADKSLWLRLDRAADTFTAKASADGASWSTVAAWNVPQAPSAPATTGTSAARATPTASASPTATATATATATPSVPVKPQPNAAPLCFTQWGVVVTSSGSNAASAPAVFRDFEVTPSQSATPSPTPAG